MLEPGFRFFELEYEFPNQEMPAWSSRVDRWYQLDAYAYGLAEVGWRYRERLSSPCIILLASQRASNESDYQFVASGGSSAQRFAQTLPNIRSSALCSAVQWSGPLLCLQKDPFTLVSAIREALRFFDGNPVWVCGARCDGPITFPGAKAYRSYLIEFINTQNRAPKGFSFNLDCDLNKRDIEVLDWFRSAEA